MYYNLTEDQKIFLETSYSMIKAGYTLEEVEEFWSSEDEDNVKNILESVDYVDIDRKDADLQEVVGIGARILGGIGLALKGAKTAKKLKDLRKLAQIAKPTNNQRKAIIRLRNELGDKAKDIKIKYRQTPRDEMAKTLKKTTGADDYFKTVRPGSDGSATALGNSARTWERTGQVVQQVQPTTTTAAATTTKAVSKLPKKPPSKVKSVASGLLGTAVTGGALLYTPSSEKSDTPAVTSCPDNMKRDTNGDCVFKVKVGDTVGGDDMQPSSSQQQTTTQQQPPTTTTTQQQTSPTTQPSTTSTKRKSNKVDWRSWVDQNIPR